MKTWLLAWEFGTGLGHFRRLAAIAEALAEDGDRIVVAAPEPNTVQAAFSRLVESVAAPAPSAPPMIEPAAGFLPSYGAALRELGFADAEYLAARVRLWDELLSRLRPDALVADHAPFAIFAAKDRFPTVVLGAGLDLPPADGESFPTVLQSAAPFDESGLRHALAAAAAATGRPGPESAPAAVRGDRRFLVGLPIFDPYLGRRPEPHLGPLGPRPALSPCPSEGRIFAYLRSDSPSFKPLTWALAEAGIPAVVHWQGPSDPGTAALLASRGAEVLTRPADAFAELARASLVVSLGGKGLTAQALYAARPQLIYPVHLDSELQALGVERLGAGRRFSRLGVRQLLEMSADSLALRDGAMRAALDLHRDFGQDPAARVAAEIRGLA